MSKKLNASISPVIFVVLSLYVMIGTSLYSYISQHGLPILLDKQPTPIDASTDNQMENEGLQSQESELLVGDGLAPKQTVLTHLYNLDEISPACTLVNDGSEYWKTSDGEPYWFIFEIQMETYDCGYENTFQVILSDNPHDIRAVHKNGEGFEVYFDRNLVYQSSYITTIDGFQKFSDDLYFLEFYGGNDDIHRNGYLIINGEGKIVQDGFLAHIDEARINNQGNLTYNIMGDVTTGADSVMGWQQLCFGNYNDNDLFRQKYRAVVSSDGHISEPELISTETMGYFCGSEDIQWLIEERNSEMR